MHNLDLIYFKCKAKHVSGGERRKLAIGMAIINDPEILLLDEPYAALDILSIKMIQEIIINYNQWTGCQFCMRS